MARIFLSELLTEVQAFGDLTADASSKAIDAKAKADAAAEAANAKTQIDIRLRDALSQLKADLDSFAYPMPEPEPDPIPDGGPSFASFESNVKSQLVSQGIFNGRILDLLRVRRNIVEELVKGGVDRKSAQNVVGKFGDGHIIDLLIKYGPTIYAIARAIALMFGIPLPPLPPLPV